MKRSIILILLLVITKSISFGQESETPGNSLGVVFNPGFESPGTKIYTTGIRYMHSTSNVFGFGVELDYQQIIGTYSNSDGAAGIAFARMTPFDKGFFAEIGIQGYQFISTSRSSAKSPMAYYPYVALGYQLKISQSFNVELQARPFTFNGNKFDLRTSGNKGAISQKFYLGLNYAFN